MTRKTRGSEKLAVKRQEKLSQSVTKQVSTVRIRTARPKAGSVETRETPSRETWWAVDEEARVI